MLENLENICAVSGMEESMREYLQEQLTPYCTSTNVDGMGNLHAYQKGSGASILLVAHMDEPGIIVTQITEDGYLHFEPVGRINPAFLVSKKVFLGSCTGIISLKAIHLTTKKEREIPIKASQLLIDIGANSKEEAEAFVTVGDYGILDIPYCSLADDHIKGRAIAGRMGCLSVIEILKKFLGCNIHAVFTVQREIGSRGILACGNSLNADLTIVFDDIPAKSYTIESSRKPETGKGVVLITRHTGGIVDSALSSQCKEIAEREGIPLQFGIAKKTGPEAVLIKTGRHRILPLAIPVRYFDSTSPIANTKDMHAMTKLAYCVITEFCKGEN